MIKITHRGSFDHTLRFLKRMNRGVYLRELEKYAREGVDALADATPKETGETAASWKYEIEKHERGVTIHWINTHVERGINIAVILEYGHGTRNGGYVQGREYINPAIQPIFDKIAASAWKEVTAK